MFIYNSQKIRKNILERIQQNLYNDGMDTVGKILKKSMWNVKIMCGRDDFCESRESKQKNQRKD